MPLTVSLSARYINALRQLPQYACNAENTGPVTHALTGVQILPLGDITDPGDDSGLLEVIFPGGHRIEVIAGMFFQLALKEAAEIEITTSPYDFNIPPSHQSFVQVRLTELGRHLKRKHALSELQ
ncbi:hypothetical protein HWE02_08455 [Pseudomonas oryzihabitans]|uniref:hypothetical protein n=1 Tax=Pseudomonas oryzihabitans TaxID=47885 RepID=UPI001F52A6FF|nr:hypothetical protein [Pseudomonas oryzihabitans]MCI1009291.1 hypothetical protein [Pseudomonas oryzihabitans]